MTTRRTTRVAVLVTAFGLVAAACGGGDDDDAEPAPAATAAPAEAAPAADAGAGESGGAVVPAALQFSAPLIGGGQIDANELAGKPTAFWFWSPT